MFSRYPLAIYRDQPGRQRGLKPLRYRGVDVWSCGGYSRATLREKGSEAREIANAMLGHEVDARDRRYA